MARFAVLWLLAIALFGCTVREKLSSGGGTASGTPEATAEQFASNMANKSYGDAYALTSKDWQKKWTEEGTRAFFEVLARGYEKKIGKPLEVDKIDVKKGDLPKDPLEARERFGVTTEPPFKSWKAWVNAELRTKDGQTAAVFPMLIVEEGGTHKVAFVAFKSRY
ncbi:MAG TPA: hypothetical protein PLX06_11170 [Fimbriimonadaceae bacterium]|nr:hypothetical protein [Fimbriimonadaceae bacterium]